MKKDSILICEGQRKLLVPNTLFGTPEIERFLKVFENDFSIVKTLAQGKSVPPYHWETC